MHEGRDQLLAVVLEPDAHRLQGEGASCHLLADRFDRSPDGQAFRMAYGALEAVVRLDPERTEARRRLVKLAMLPRNPHYYQDAKDHLEALLVDSPKAPDLLEQLAECQIGLHRFDQLERR